MILNSMLIIKNKGKNIENKNHIYLRGVAGMPTFQKGLQYF